MNNESQTALGKLGNLNLKRLCGLCLAKGHHMVGLKPNADFLPQAMVVMAGHQG
jgi:hypothetical protein